MDGQPPEPIGPTDLPAGSPAAQSDDGGQNVERRGFDAFGAPREGSWAPRPNGQLGSALSPRGFTGHEHLDAAGGLIHMNGRAYDPRLGRFLGVDPIIQFPENSQSLNPYSYILNNPMAGTDPSGYCAVAVTGSNIRDTSGCRPHNVTVLMGDGAREFLGTFRPGHHGDRMRARAIGIPGLNGSRQGQGPQQRSVADGRDSTRLGRSEREPSLTRREQRRLDRNIDKWLASDANSSENWLAHCRACQMNEALERLHAEGKLSNEELQEIREQQAIAGISAVTAVIPATWLARIPAIGRFFYNPVPFNRVSRSYWAARGPASGRSLHHWLFPQRATWVPVGFRNAGFNLINLPAFQGAFHRTLGLNQWMGFAKNWGAAHASHAALIERTIRVGIPSAAAGAGYVGYESGSLLHDLLWRN